jgi:hypothetical protein
MAGSGEATRVSGCVLDAVNPDAAELTCQLWTRIGQGLWSR